MFGSKKIYAKIMNGKLVIRVGGGYMSIDEFMKHYGLQEMQRQQRAMLDEEYDDEADPSEALEQELDGKGKTIGIAQAKAALRGKSGKSLTVVKKGTKSGLKRPTTAATDLEAQLRALEKQAADGTLKEGMLNLDV